MYAYEYFYSAKYNRTERLCANFLAVAGYYVFISHCMFCYYIFLHIRTTIRPVLKHGPRSSTGLRVVEFNTKLIHGEAKAKYVRCRLYYCSTG